MWTSGIDSVVVDAYKTAQKPFVPVVGADNNGFVGQLIDLEGRRASAAPPSPIRPRSAAPASAVALDVLQKKEHPHVIKITPEVWDNSTDANTRGAEEDLRSQARSRSTASISTCRPIRPTPWTRSWPARVPPEAGLAHRAGRARVHGGPSPPWTASHPSGDDGPMTGEALLLEARDVAKSFNSVVALRAADAERRAPARSMR